MLILFTKITRLSYELPGPARWNPFRAITTSGCSGQVLSLFFGFAFYFLIAITQNISYVSSVELWL